LATRIAEPVTRLADRRFFDSPLGREQRASREKYLNIWEAARAKQYPEIDAYEDSQGFRIDNDWFQELALLTQVGIKQSEICYQHGRVLYSTLASYITRNRPRNLNILETGTARGFSCLCMAKALYDQEQPGKIVTFDVLPHDTAMYWNCIADAEGPNSQSDLLSHYQSLLEDFVIFQRGIRAGIYRVSKWAEFTLHFSMAHIPSMMYCRSSTRSWISK
jgi:hypothetical protein